MINWLGISEEKTIVEQNPLNKIVGIYVNRDKFNRIFAHEYGALFSWGVIEVFNGTEIFILRVDAAERLTNSTSRLIAIPTTGKRQWARILDRISKLSSLVYTDKDLSFVAFDNELSWSVFDQESKKVKYATQHLSDLVSTDADSFFHGYSDFITYEITSTRFPPYTQISANVYNTMNLTSDNRGILVVKTLNLSGAIGSEVENKLNYVHDLQDRAPKFLIHYRFGQLDDDFYFGLYQDGTFGLFRDRDGERRLFLGSACDEALDALYSRTAKESSSAQMIRYHLITILLPIGMIRQNKT